MLFAKKWMYSGSSLLFADGGGQNERKRVAVRRSEASANCAVQRTAIFICVSINRGRNDLGKKAVAATKRKKSETF